MQGFFVSNHDFFHFLSGLFFIFIAGTSFLLIRIDGKFAWRSMFLFALLQGGFQWLTVLDQNIFPQKELLVAAIKYLVFLISFILLADFGIACFLEERSKIRGFFSCLLLLCAAVTSIVGGMISITIIVLCVISSFVAAAGLFARAGETVHSKSLFRIASVFFLVFGLLAWIVHPGIYYYLKDDNFLQMLGIPSVALLIVPQAGILVVFSIYYNRCKQNIYADRMVSGHFRVMAAVIFFSTIVGFSYINWEVHKATTVFWSDCDTVSAYVFSRQDMIAGLHDFLEKGTSADSLVRHLDRLFDRVSNRCAYAFGVVTADGSRLKLDRSVLLGWHPVKHLPTHLLPHPKNDHSGMRSTNFIGFNDFNDRGHLTYVITSLPNHFDDGKKYYFIISSEADNAISTILMLRQNSLIAMELLSFLIIMFWIAYVNNEDITRQLTNARNEYAGLVEMQRDIIVRFNLDYKFTFVNNVFCHVAGFTREMLLGNDIGRVFNWEKFLYDIRTMPLEGCVKFIVPMTLPKGTCWHEWQVTKVSSFRQVKYEFQAVGRDVTKLQEAMKSLQESEKKYRQVVDLANEGIWVINNKNVTAFANRRMADILGIKLNELIGSPLENYVGNGEKVELAKCVDRRKNGVCEKHDFIFTRRDGCTVSTTLATTPMFDDDGKYVGALAIVVDVTRFRQMEENLRNLNNELSSALSFNQLVLDNDPNLIYVMDNNHRLIMANQAFISFFGASSKVVKGKHLGDIIGKKTISPLPCETDDEVFYANEKREFEEKILMGGNRYSWFRTVKMPLILQHNESGILCISVDITKMKDAENRREKVNHELEEKVARRTNSLNKTIKRLTREIDSKQELQRLLQKESERIQERLGQNLHDVLGQMLTAISIKANVLRDILPEEHQRQHADVIVEYTGEAISQMRNLSKTLSYVNIRKLGLEMGMNDFKDFINKFYNVDVYLNIDSDVIAMLEEESQNNLFRIVQESIVNAIKHSNAKRITLDLQRDGKDSGLLKISSNGTEFIDQEMNRAEGIGILIMETRAAVMGATLKLERTSYSGLEVICRFPLTLNSEALNDN